MIGSEAVFYKMQEQLFRKSREARMRGTHDAIVRQRELIRIRDLINLIGFYSCGQVPFFLQYAFLKVYS